MIDWKRIAEMKEEIGEDDFAEVVEMFFEEAIEVLAALQPDNAQSLGSDLHFLKGSAMNMGLQAVSEICGDAECELRNRPHLRVDIVPIRDVFEKSKALLESER